MPLANVATLEDDDMVLPDPSTSTESPTPTLVRALRWYIQIDTNWRHQLVHEPLHSLVALHIESGLESASVEALHLPMLRYLYIMVYMHNRASYLTR